VISKITMDSIISCCNKRAPKSEEKKQFLPVNRAFEDCEKRDAMSFAEKTRDGVMDRDGVIQLSTDLAETNLKMPPRQDGTVVDARDADTPDAWVKRHKDMVRLTGRHPFNSEPPLKSLQEAGWITPPSLHVVRNHGAVPKFSWEDHKLHISGVPRPCSLSMEEIASGNVAPLVSIPVSFICAGNRRKEQNMTKKTIGFNWGCAAVGNSIWTGVRLCDVLAHCGITKVSNQHRFVCFEGPEGELPQGKTGSYGTSIDMGWALDRERDVLLAFKQNGELLAPDHGFPIRTLLPGCIGGRMIKWLCKMWVAAEPSDNHYHFFDNRVLPPHVDAELATKEGWWYKPDYIINHININSAMFEPRHNSVFAVSGPKSAKTMKVCGYAYVGGGLKIIRAEISLDEGKSWEITDLTRPEDEIAAARGTDKHWCWSWWETEIDAARLLQCKEIRCRACDSNQNMQPAELTWNVMGMMNNCLFRIKVHPRKDEGGNSTVWFEHPTMPGNETGGWMTEDAGVFDPAIASEAAPGPKGVSPSRPVAAIWTGKKKAAVALPPAAKTDEAGKLVKAKPEWLKDGISPQEVQQNNNDKSAWIVVKDRVYDCTPYLADHPGGASSILISAGMEATEDFEAVHSKKAWSMLEDYYIGKLKAPMSTVMAIEEDEDENTFLRVTKVQKLPLIEKIVVSHDTRIFRFGLPRPDMRLGLPTGQHMFLRAKINEETVMRPYTPATDDATLGHVDLLIKVYFKNVHPRFPDGGKMGQHLESMAIGDTIDVKGPLGEFHYLGSGSYTYNDKPRTTKRINMFAGGTGLTPCFQVANAILRDPEDPTEVALLYANQTPSDILLRETLEKLAADHPKRFKLFFTVDRVPDGMEWNHYTGFMNEEMIKNSLYAADEGTLNIMCGPPAMEKFAVRPNLEKLGHQAENMLAF